MIIRYTAFAATLLTVAAACGPTGEREEAVSDDDAVLEGMFTYYADAAAFRSCAGTSYPVAMEGAYIDLERAYLALALPEPATPVLARVEGEITDRPAMEGGAPVPTLVVHRLIDVDRAGACEPDGAGAPVPSRGETGDRERLEIPPGDSAVSRSGRLEGDERTEFVVRARAGQRLRVSTRSERVSWLVARAFPVQEPTGADLVNTGASGLTAGQARVPADGDYVVMLAIQRAEARRGGVVDFDLTVSLTDPSATEPPAAAGAPDEWVAEGACPFECCTYGVRWTLRESMPLRGNSDEDAMTLRQLPAGTAVTALTGRVRTTRGRFRFTRDSPPFAAGESVDVYDYQGEGRYRVWRDGGVAEAELGTSPYGASAPSPLGAMEVQPGQSWWANVRLDGADAWILVSDPTAVEGADRCVGSC